MFFEVLDNMPHDKVIFDKERKEYRKYSKVDLETMEEVEEDISKDPVVKNCLQLYIKSEASRIQEEGKLSFLDKIAKKVASKS